MRVLIFIFIICISSFGCNENRTYRNNIDDASDLSEKKNESLVKVNRYLVNSETTDIKNYIKRHNLNVVETGSGLKYEITKRGKGEKAAEGKIIAINHEVKLISGDIIYSYKEDGPLVFRIGHGGVETGLEEAILNMRAGDEAIIIIPSHLGHGLLGDSKKIPNRSTIIYEIEITNIK